MKSSNYAEQVNDEQENLYQMFERLSLSFKKQEEIVWSDLKKLHAASDWQSGVYEKEKYIETFFQIDHSLENQSILR